MVSHYSLISPERTQVRLQTWKHNHHQMNDRLSFDVLSEIFDCYAEEETIYHPLETLLLVCKSWSEAALSHRLLWARLKIYIGHAPSQKMWLTRLPRRLERSGETTPLEIDLRVISRSDQRPNTENCNHRRFMNPGCNCIALASITIESLLIILAGADGELCKRWRSLCLRSISSLHTSIPLSHPTPILTVLRYERVSITEGIWPVLPALPSLHTLHVIGSRRLPLPKFDSIRELVLDSEWMPLPAGFADLHTATKLERLAIRVNRPVTYRFPDRLPNLEFLSLEGRQMPTNIATFQAPNLLRLSLNSDKASTYRLIIDSSLPFSNLRELRLVWIDNNYSYGLKQFLAFTEHLLVRCTSLARIEGNGEALTIIVRLLWGKNGEMGSYVEKMAGKAVTYWSSDTNMQITIDRPDSEDDLMALVYRLGLVEPQTHREAVWLWLDACVM
jgi:hypothetical protein